MLRDLDLLPQDRQDTRRLEVVADCLPLHQGVQLAIDTTMVSPLRRDGVPPATEHDGGRGFFGDSQETEVLPTGAAKQVQLGCARWRVQSGLSLLPGAAQTCTFHRPPAHFASQDDQSGPGAGSDEFRISALFPTPNDLQRHDIYVGGAKACSARHSEESSPEWHRWQVPNHHVCGVDPRQFINLESGTVQTRQ